ncbi:MAG: dTDP-4-dehydrorhamnose reductase [Balneola sp.]
MKLLITGAGGQLGQEWVFFCKTKNVSYKAFTSAELDITSEETLLYSIQEFNPDAVVNCAAYTKVDQAEDEEEKAELVNATAPGVLSEVCKKQGVKLVHYSTDYVFSGTKKDQSELPDGYPETYQTDPINVYGRTKRNGEVAIQESGCEYLILRVSWLCGTYGNNFVKTMLRLGQERDKLTVVNDQFGSPTFADQVVEQSFELIKQNRKGIFHLSSEGTTTWFEFAKEIFTQRQLDVEVVPVASSEFRTKAVRPHFSKLSTQKISTIPGVTILSWRDGLKRLLTTI